MASTDISYVKKEYSAPTPESMHGVIKPKKKLDTLTEAIVGLLTDYYTAYFKQHGLAPVSNIKEDAQIIKDNPDYQPPMVALLFILRMVNSDTGFECAQMLQNVYTSYRELNCEPFDAVSNLLAMFEVKFDEQNNPRIEVLDAGTEIQVTIPITPED